MATTPIDIPNLPQALDDHLCELLGTSRLVVNDGGNTARVRDLTRFAPSRNPKHAFELIAARRPPT